MRRKNATGDEVSRALTERKPRERNCGSGKSRFPLAWLTLENGGEKESGARVSHTNKCEMKKKLLTYIALPVLLFYSFG
jgi:hypothetical protein